MSHHDEVGGTNPTADTPWLPCNNITKVLESISYLVARVSNVYNTHSDKSCHFCEIFQSLGHDVDALIPSLEEANEQIITQLQEYDDTIHELQQTCDELQTQHDSDQAELEWLRELVQTQQRTIDEQQQTLEDVQLGYNPPPLSSSALGRGDQGGRTTTTPRSDRTSSSSSLSSSSLRRAPPQKTTSGVGRAATQQGSHSSHQRLPQRGSTQSTANIPSRGAGAGAGAGAGGIGYPVTRNTSPTLHPPPLGQTASSASASFSSPQLSTSSTKSDHTSLVELQSKLEIATNTIQNLEFELEYYQNKTNVMVQTSQTKEENIVQLTADLHQIEVKYDKLERDYQSLLLEQEKQQQTYHTQYGQLRGEMASLTQENIDLRSDIIQHAQDLDKTLQELSDVQSEFTKYKSQVEVEKMNRLASEHDLYSPILLLSTEKSIPADPNSVISHPEGINSHQPPSQPNDLNHNNNLLNDSLNASHRHHSSNRFISSAPSPDLSPIITGNRVHLDSSFRLPSTPAKGLPSGGSTTVYSLSSTPTKTNNTSTTTTTVHQNGSTLHTHNTSSDGRETSSVFGNSAIQHPTNIFLEYGILQQKYEQATALVRGLRNEVSILRFQQETTDKHHKQIIDESKQLETLLASTQGELLTLQSRQEQADYNHHEQLQYYKDKVDTIEQQLQLNISYRDRYYESLSIRQLLEVNYAKAKVVIDALQEQLKTHQTLQTQYNDLQSSIAIERRDNVRALTAAKTMSEKYERLQATCTAQQAQLQTFQQQLDDVTASNTAYKGQINKLTQDIDRYTHQIDSLNAEITKLEAVQSKYHQLEQTHRELLQHLQLTEQRSQERLSQNEALERTIDQLKQDIRDLQANNDVYNSEKTVHFNSASYLQDKIDTLTEDNSHLQKRITRLEEQIQTLRQEKDQMYRAMVASNRQKDTAELTQRYTAAAAGPPTTPFRSHNQSIHGNSEDDPQYATFLRDYHNLQQRFTSLTQDYQKIQGDFKSKTAQLARLESQITDLTNQVKYKEQMIDHLQRESSSSSTAAIADLEHENTKLLTQIKKIQDYVSTYKDKAERKLNIMYQSYLELTRHTKPIIQVILKYESIIAPHQQLNQLIELAEYVLQLLKKDIVADIRSVSSTATTQVI